MVSLAIANLVTFTCFLSYLFLELLKVNSAFQGTTVLTPLFCFPGSLGLLGQWEALVIDCEVGERKKPGHFPAHCASSAA